MRYKAVAAIVLAATSIGQGAARADEMPGSSFVAGGWRGAAYDFQQRFSHCIAVKAGPNGIAVGLLLTQDGSAQIAWHHADFRFPVGRRVPVKLSIDSFPPMPLTAVAVAAPGTVNVDLPDQTQIQPQFSRGGMLAMIIEGRRYVIGLEGIYPPLAACVDMQSHGASGAPAPSAAPDRPPSSPRAQTPKVGEATPLRREAEQFVGKILMRPGMHAVRLLPETVRAEMPAKYSDDAIWSAPGMLGQLKIISTGSVADADKVLSLIGAVDETGCKVGAFRSGQRDDMPGGSAIRSFFDCVEGGRHGLTVHTILRRSESSYYVFSLFSDPEMRDSHKMVEQMDGVLRRAIFDVMGR